MRPSTLPFGQRATARRMLNAASCVASVLAFLVVTPRVLRCEPVMGPIPICTAPGDQWIDGIASDGADGAFIAWVDYAASAFHLYVQRLLSSGEIAPGWPAAGLPVCTISQVLDVDMCPDGAGGAFLVWEDARFGQDQ